MAKELSFINEAAEAHRRQDEIEKPNWFVSTMTTVSNLPIIRQVFRELSRPGYIIGNMIEGDFKNAFTVALPFSEIDTEEATSVSDVMLPKDSYWAFKLGLDVVTDPLSWTGVGGFAKFGVRMNGLTAKGAVAARASKIASRAQSQFLGDWKKLPEYARLKNFAKKMSVDLDNAPGITQFGDTLAEQFANGHRSALSVGFGSLRWEATGAKAEHFMDFLSDYSKAGAFGGTMGFMAGGATLGPIGSMIGTVIGTGLGAKLPAGQKAFKLFEQVFGEIKSGSMKTFEFIRNGQKARLKYLADDRYKTWFNNATEQLDETQFGALYQKWEALLETDVKFTARSTKTDAAGNVKKFDLPEVAVDRTLLTETAKKLDPQVRPNERELEVIAQGMEMIETFRQHAGQFGVKIPSRIQDLKKFVETTGPAMQKKIATLYASDFLRRSTKVFKDLGTNIQRMQSQVRVLADRDMVDLGAKVIGDLRTEFRDLVRKTPGESLQGKMDLFVTNASRGLDEMEEIIGNSAAFRGQKMTTDQISQARRIVRETQIISDLVTSQGVMRRIKGAVEETDGLPLAAALKELNSADLSLLRNELTKPFVGDALAEASDWGRILKAAQKITPADGVKRMGTLGLTPRLVERIVMSDPIRDFTTRRWKFPDAPKRSFKTLEEAQKFREEMTGVWFATAEGATVARLREIVDKGRRVPISLTTQISETRRIAGAVARAQDHIDRAPAYLPHIATPEFMQFAMEEAPEAIRTSLGKTENARMLQMAFREGFETQEGMIGLDGFKHGKPLTIDEINEMITNPPKLRGGIARQFAQSLGDSPKVQKLIESGKATNLKDAIDKGLIKEVSEFFLTDTRAILAGAKDDFLRSVQATDHFAQAARLFGRAGTNREGLARSALTGIKREGIDSLELRGWVQVRPDDRVLKGIYFPKELAETIIKQDELITNVDGMRKMLNGYDRILNVWKTQATVLAPAFHGRNWISNAFLSHLRGVHLWDPRALPTYVKALRIQVAMARKDNAALQRMKFNVNGTDIDGVQMGEMLMRNRAMEGSSMFNYELDLSNLTSNRQAFGKNGSVVSKLGKPFTKPAEWGRTAGGFVEDNSKIAHVIWKMEVEGFDEINAGMSAMETMFDYRDVTTIERGVFKRLFPFYTWSRRSTPSMVGALFHNPGKIRNMERFLIDPKTGVQIGGFGPKEDPLPAELTPHWIQDQFGVPVKFDDKGNPSYFLLESWIPVFELNKVTRDPKAMGDEIAGQLTPILKVPFEIWKNESLFFKREIERFRGEETTYLGMNVTKRAKHIASNVRVLNELDNFVRAFADVPDFQKRSLMDSILRASFGVKLSKVDIKRQLATKEFELRKQRSKVEALLNRAGKLQQEGNERKLAVELDDVLRRQRQLEALERETP